MILAALWKRGAAAGSPLHTALDWSIQFLVVFVIVGISAAGVGARQPSRGGPAR
jgi:hypothetical protein